MGWDKPDDSDISAEAEISIFIAMVDIVVRCPADLGVYIRRWDGGKGG